MCKSVDYFKSEVVECDECTKTASFLFIVEKILGYETVDPSWGSVQVVPWRCQGHPFWH